MPNGKWGRFLELGTNKALYYDRGRIRVDSLHQLSLERRTGYGYETDLSSALAAAEQRFQGLTEPTTKAAVPDPLTQLRQLAESVQKVIDSQDAKGRWILHNDQFRKEVQGQIWNGEYRVEDRISSRLFNTNVDLICNFLSLLNRTYKRH